MNCPGCDARDLALALAVAAEARLREEVDGLLGVLARVAVERFQLRRVADEQICARVQAEGRLDLTRRALANVREAQRGGTAA